MDLYRRCFPEPILKVYFLVSPSTSNPLLTMLSYAIIFLIIALIAGVLGFGVVAGTAATIAKICFVVFLILFVVSLIRGRGRNL